MRGNSLAVGQSFRAVMSFFLSEKCGVDLNDLSVSDLAAMQYRHVSFRTVPTGCTAVIEYFRARGKGRSTAAVTGSWHHVPATGCL